MGSQQQPWMFVEDRFGRRLKFEREQRGMTQADVAQVLSREHDLRLHPSAVAKMEQRDVDKPRAIRLYEARAIADVFGLTIDEMTSSENAELEELSREFMQLGSQAEALRARTDELFVRLREMHSIMAVPRDQVSTELQEYRNRIIKSLAALHETGEARRVKAEALLDEVEASNPLLRDDAALNAATVMAAAADRLAGPGDGPNPEDVALFDELSRPEAQPGNQHLAETGKPPLPATQAHQTRERALQSLGQRFRAARENSGATLADASKASQVPLVFIRKIEKGDYSRMGNDARIRGLIRAYSFVVGLRPEIALAEYAAAQTLPNEESR